MNYIEHAKNIISKFFPFVNNWCNEDDIIDAIEKMFWKCNEHVSFEMGCVRYVLIGKDFVIKWDYDKESAENVGGCEDEYNLYNQLKNNKFAYLFCPITRVEYKEHNFYIMPRVEKIGLREHHYKEIKDFLNIEELIFLQSYVGDLHGGNWGLENNKPIIIDYACKPGCSY